MTNYLAVTVPFLVNLFAFILHILIWRICRPKNSSAGLILIFLIVISIGSFSLTHPFIIGSNLPWDMRFLVFLTSGMIGACYIASYPAIENDSPSLRISYCISKAGKMGIRAEEVVNLLASDQLSLDRIQQMVDEGLVVQIEDRYFQTKQGEMLAKFFLYWRKILGAKVGG